MMQAIRHIFQSDDLAEARPFYIILTVLILITCALTLFQPPNPMPFGRIPVFGLLLLLHLGLHWTSGLVAKRSRWHAGYLVGQGVLALALVLVSQRPELVLVFYAALIAETLGLFGLTRLTAVSVGGYVLLTFVAFYLLGEQPLLAEWTSPAISTLALCIVFMVLYRRQSEARQRSQALLAELETAHHQLADYATQVEDLTLAAERQRMARELHDTLAQGVASLVLRLEAANNHLENGRIPRAQEIVQQSMKRARSTLAAARAAIDDLRLDNKTLDEAIQQRVDRFTQATGIVCHLTLDLAQETAVPLTIADHAERIISESLANITRHAQANNVWLDVAQSGERLTIEVRDDGVGFDAETAVRAGHYGLLGMRERTRLVNGTFEIGSEPEKGARLSITLPLEAS
ncbi:sensor histidine kinase [Candidatus Leptofilum sp.]|uniref:sensor histidine kinase n=1 Tax=Candidatus Leptofilum sp. TaxID=3241576 RepID=UPI003B5A30AF